MKVKIRLNSVIMQPCACISTAWKTKLFNVVVCLFYYLGSLEVQHYKGGRELQLIHQNIEIFRQNELQ